LSPPLIGFFGLSHVFPDGGVGLRDVTLEFGEGGLALLAGRNGAGKSLLMKHAIGLAIPTRGTILLRGRPLDASRARAEIGYVFQDAEASFIGETVFADALFGPANLGLPKDEAKRRASEALASVGLADKAGLSPFLISGGEKRRLSVAGILAAGSGTIIFDEPFANLDYPSIRELLALMLRLKAEGKTLIVVTHEIEKLLAHADRLVVMDKGRIALDMAPGDAANVDLEPYGLRNPLRGKARLEDLSWLE
jgi:biotin transport system ATP-binding protein